MREPLVAALTIALLMTGAIGAARADDPPARPEDGDRGATPDPATDERVAALEKRIAELERAYEERIKALEAEVAALKGPPGSGPAGGGEAAAPRPPATPSAAPPPVPSPAPAAPPPTGGSSQTSTYFNPAVSVIGNFLAVGGTNNTENLPAASLRESEVGLQAIVDPYARADFFLSFGEEGVAVEEGFATFTSLPWGLLAKVGRMRTSFGKINTLHLHVLPWPDEPLPNVNLLGGEEGWIGDGVSIAKMIALPRDVFSEVTVQVFDGSSGKLFSAPSRGDLSYNGHYRIFSDLGESMNIDAGLSYGFGPNGITTRSETRLGAIDTTFRWKPLRTATYRSAIVRGELVRSRKDELTGTETAGGWFLSGDYQLAKRWFLGARYERADHADDGSVHDTGEALLVTFWPSEFSQLRGELRRRSYANGETADEFLMQVQFAIGAHGAHPF